MAGTIQTMILTPRSTQTPSFRHQHLNFTATRTTAYSTRSVLFTRSRSISFPLRIRANQGPGQIDDNGSGGAKTLGKSLLNFADNNFLPLALIGGVVLGLANPALGCLADKYYLSKFSTIAIFITSGLTLRNGEIGDAIEAWPVGILGICSILLFTPYLSKIILQIQLQPQEFVTGLAIFCCMPTTLSSGVALTQVPFSISKFIAAGIGVSVPTKELFRSLVITLLIPLILGKVFRESLKGLADYVDRNRKLFSKMNAIFLSLAPFIQVSRSRSMLLMVKPSVFLVAVGMGVILHLVLLSFNVFAIQGFSMVSGTNQLAFAKKKMQLLTCLLPKTLPVMVAVVEQLGGAFGESGLLVLPCVAAHLNQIIMDSFFVNFWLRKDLASESAKQIIKLIFQLFLIQCLTMKFINILIFKNNIKNM
ncbi:sodium/metabolite cotransporter BASS [Salix suchowensis]|nr:sodium/metabolite cotransporter BASS [Salix suchowensis]